MNQNVLKCEATLNLYIPVLAVKPELYPRVDENKVITAETLLITPHCLSLSNCLSRAETALPWGRFSNH